MLARLRTANQTEWKTPIPLLFRSRVAWVSPQRRAAPPSGSLATIISYFFCCDYYAYNAKNIQQQHHHHNRKPTRPPKSAVLKKGPRLGPKSVPPDGSRNSWWNRIAGQVGWSIGGPFFWGCWVRGVWVQRGWGGVRGEGVMWCEMRRSEMV